ncbi:Flp family type IVb pilin [Erwinia tasmaniensis]|uniref:Flp family type IVb pilin n=1 Tax=Erwinia tasmaniensis TaxID=338565 RepID=UPI003A4DCCB7
MTNIFIRAYVFSSLHLKQLVKDKRGVTAIEYALIGVAMATLLALVLGNQDSGFLGALKSTFAKIADAITSVTVNKSSGR